MNAREMFPWEDVESGPNWQAMCDLIDAQQAELERLRAELDEKSLAIIEARNPGIDMDDVRRLRAGAAPTPQPAPTTGGET